MIGILYIGFEITQSLTQLQAAVNKIILEETGSFLLMRKADNVLVANPKFNAGEPVTESILDGLTLSQATQDQSEFRYTNSKTNLCLPTPKR